MILLIIIISGLWVWASAVEDQKRRLEMRLLVLLLTTWIIVGAFVPFMSIGSAIQSIFDGAHEGAEYHERMDE
jgi:hypothetical protein